MLRRSAAVERSPASPRSPLPSATSSFMTPSSPAGLRLFPLVFAALSGTMAMMAFVAVIGPIVRLLGLLEWHAGLSVTAAGFLWMLLARRWGVLSDRIGRRRVMMIGLSAYAVVYIAMSVFIDLALDAPPAVWLSVLALVGARALIGAFYAAIPPTAAAIIADHTTPQTRTSTLAKLGSANAIGMVIGPAAAGMLAVHGLEWPLYSAAALPLLSLLVIVFMLPADAPKAADQRPQRATVTALDARLRLPVLAAFAAMVSVSIAQVVVGFFAIDRLGLDMESGARAAGLALTAVGCALIVAQMLVMRLKQVTPLAWIRVGAGIAAVGFASVALCHAQAPLLAAYALGAFGMGFLFPAFQAKAANAVQPHEQGAAAGSVASAQGLGMVVGPLIGTSLYALSPAAPYLLVGGVLAALAVAAFLTVTPSAVASADAAPSPRAAS